MRTPPPEFVKRLEREFDGRFRIRWSPIRFRWQLEEKVGRAAGDFPLNGDGWNDDLQRIADGYVLYAEISPGTKTPCPTCHTDMEAVPYELVQVKCQVCAREGRHGGCVTGFWPLNDQLLDRLRSTDPNRGGYERYHPRLIRALNTRRQELRSRFAFDEARNAGRDDARLDIAKVGHTGKETMWTNAPESPRLAPAGATS